ncbi:unnamed protein product [Fraxinus pennsylvanica]|uniref:Uncharacterized protein n=1 Tax=Fraxinus pennsylvanica TaxID=56036 RepID=A0AAD2E701_9LAMI|nr:unnamed protein product [Fraxinus pennsylvanica]
MVDKGVEIQDKDEDGQSEENSVKRSVSSEIKALESMMGEEKADKADEETASQILDADEETVTREFLQMLEGVEANKFKIDPEILFPKVESNENTGDRVLSFPTRSREGIGLRGPITQRRLHGSYESSGYYNCLETHTKTRNADIQAIHSPII